ncbi:MAG: indolepyruvate ferredoxin oxidoreductase [Bordetella sp. SCN 67-23]|nr:indolepyruvate ferredoxin oxidoreductase subunit alpha [Burkholderiales bacterium]ODS74383.1 MAG: indolepyruvate ferredoxin oxidoreductase [Bordetella sp. SCN 67-23]ODU91387.1 MAG: indolepyruvate ferredoxin oxidoreductase [Bordetella sp. SCN 68-11]OJW89582.1 MAG: indolepyruvate ferredoxin oxidoreductase [Burkholderiales bacterium 67-32]
MAERSFKQEVTKLRLGAGQEFEGEGILAVTKALLQSGVSYVGGYQGSPVSHLMDVLADASEILDELGVHFESSASEATAAAMLGASVHYPLRGAITFKSTVGTNVASDALSNLASGGVTGGALIILGEDYGEGSSIIQERSHAFAMKSQMWLLDPRPNLPSLVRAVQQSFDLSEASNTPVMLTLRIRACHAHGRFAATDNRRPAFSLKDAIEQPRRDVERMALAPATFVHEHEKITQRWKAAEDFVREHGLNECFDGEARHVGIIVQGGLYNTLMRVLELMGLANIYGDTDIPIYVMNVVYPVVEDEVLDFCRGKDAVLMLEEGQPEFIEQALHTILRRADVATVLHGKDILPRAGEYTPRVVMKGLRRFLDRHAPGLAGRRPVPEGVAQMLEPRIPPIVPSMPGVALEKVDEVLPRPPSFCTGCPERPIFTAMKMVERRIGKHYVSADIGCHQFAALAPFNIGATSMGYGLGAAGAAALNTGETDRRTVSIMGDGGFWHNGLTSGIGNAVFNRSNNVTVIVDNGYSAATGGQDILSSAADTPTRSTHHGIEAAVRGVGVEWVRTVTHTYDLQQMQSVLNEALTTDAPGPKVVIAQSECMLNKQRRIKPRQRQMAKEGRRVVKEQFGVDHDTCTGDHSCIRLSGCPSLSIKDNPDPLRRDPVATVLPSCVGCGLCGEVSHAAVLCPSFYRADVVTNPTRLETLGARLAGKIIGFLQRRLAKQEYRHAA